jgi:inorganic pyrophosphatase
MRKGGKRASSLLSHSVRSIVSRPRRLSNSSVVLGGVVSRLGWGQVVTRQTGELGEKTFALYFYKDETRISPWHDIPLVGDETKTTNSTFHFVVEIPKGTRHKLEIETETAWNPIRQDTRKDGSLRYLGWDVLHNYGCLPQTWEDPTEKRSDLNLMGDNDPIDVIELGFQKVTSGQVLKVKIVGALALIDEGEIDWKVLAINTEDPLASYLNDINDVEKNMPGAIDRVRDWYRSYKTLDGKPPNTYAYDGKALDKAFALDVIQQGHNSWKKLFKGKLSPKFAYESMNTSQK